jgi:hypothetical protein
VQVSVNNVGLLLPGYSERKGKQVQVSPQLAFLWTSGSFGVTWHSGRPMNSDAIAVMPVVIGTQDVLSVCERQRTGNAENPNVATPVGEKRRGCDVQYFQVSRFHCWSETT